MQVVTENGVHISAIQRIVIGDNVFRALSGLEILNDDFQGNTGIADANRPMLIPAKRERIRCELDAEKRSGTHDRLVPLGRRRQRCIDSLGHLPRQPSQGFVSNHECTLFPTIETGLIAMNADLARA